MNRVSSSQGAISIFLLTIMLFISGCGAEKTPQEVFLEGKTMGTTYHIKYFADDKSVDATKLQQQIDTQLKAVNQSMSTYIRDSEINTFNKLPANQVMPISEDFRAVVSESIRLGKSTKTLDVTMGPLIDLRWAR